MAWGGKKAKQKQEDLLSGTSKSGPLSSSPGLTLIGSGTCIVGTLSSDHSVNVEGTVEGDVIGKTLVTIAETGKVVGKITCGSIEIHGHVEGDVVASDLVTIAATGRLLGDITTKRFSHQPGGYFEGYSHMAKGAAAPRQEQQDMLEEEGSIL